MPDRSTRRSFLRASALTAGAVGLAPGELLAATRALRKRGDRVRLGLIGVWNRGWANLSALLGEELVALCDVDQSHLDLARQRIESETGTATKARVYRDFRVMLEREKGLDAVVVSTPDHTHAPATAMALRRGLHAYCEKPLTHSVREVRTLQKLAREKKLATQMGTQIHAGANYRRVVELIRAGAIGEVREVHVWCGKGWADGRFGDIQPVPEQLDWDLWLGPVAERPYSAGLHPASWRRFWQFGGGTLADMACHYVDLVHWALELTVPERVEADSPDELHPDGTPRDLRVHWRHPRSEQRPAVDVFWYDGARRPDHTEAWNTLEQVGATWGNGHLWIGSEGILLSDYGRHLLLPEERFAEYVRPEPSIPASIGHHAEWLQAIREGTPTTCDFQYSGALTETVLLGNVAFRRGEPLEWNTRAGKPRGDAVADLFIERTYRDGWSL